VSRPRKCFVMLVLLTPVSLGVSRTRRSSLFFATRTILLYKFWFALVTVSSG
jgi:hypothetical protein